MLSDLHGNTCRARWLGSRRCCAREAVAGAPDDRTLLALAESLRGDPPLVARLCPHIQRPNCGGLLDLTEALAAARAVADEVPELDHVLRRTRSLADAAGASDPAAALAYLRAAERTIRVDDFAP